MSLFSLGKVVTTPGALAFCNERSINPATLLNRHASGDWGDLDTHDTQANVHAIQHDLRVFSVYKFGNEKLWVISEADRASTCLLLPSEY